MCYLISYYEPVKSTGLNTLSTVVYETEETAKDCAENLLHNSCTEVRVWKLVGTPTLKTVVDWQ